MMFWSWSSSQRRAECVGVRGATQKWWPRTASWTTAPEHPGWTAARKLMSKPTLEDPKPDLLRARTSSMSGPYDLSDQVGHPQAEAWHRSWAPVKLLWVQREGFLCADGRVKLWVYAVTAVGFILILFIIALTFLLWYVPSPSVVAPMKIK